jgi:hypothetical protein
MPPVERGIFMNDIQEGVIETAPVENTEGAVQEVVATPQQSSVSSDALEVQQQTEAHTEPKQSEVQPQDRFEKAFAARLRKEQEKLESQYSPYKFVLERAAAENEMTVEEYVETLSKQYKEKELEAIPNEIREDVLWAREQRKKQTEEQTKQTETEKWNTEVKSLLTTFPDIKSVNDIPDEVLEWKAKDNVPLEYAYAKYALGKERTKIEQETLKKLRETEAAAVPSMASSSADTKLKVSNLDDAEFEKLMDEVRQGKRKSL